jgi:hypothetical protein
MSPDRAQELASIEALIERAEDELETLRLHLEATGGPPPNRSNPSDPVSCLEIWLAALCGRRAALLHPLH